MGACCVTQGAQLSVLWWPRWMGQGGDGREVQEEGGICIHMADSLHGAAETNNIVRQL